MDPSAFLQRLLVALLANSLPFTHNSRKATLRCSSLNGIEANTNHATKANQSRTNSLGLSRLKRFNGDSHPTVQPQCVGRISRRRNPPALADRGARVSLNQTAIARIVRRHTTGAIGNSAPRFSIAHSTMNSVISKR
jgi:hypothetical protein